MRQWKALRTKPAEYSTSTRGGEQIGLQRSVAIERIQAKRCLIFVGVVGGGHKGQGQPDQQQTPPQQRDSPSCLALRHAALTRQRWVSFHPRNGASSEFASQTCGLVAAICKPCKAGLKACEKAWDC